MPKKQTADTSPADTSGLAASLVGDAIAVGEDTLSYVDASLHVVDHHNVSMAKGKVIAVAAADSPEGDLAFADALTDAFVSGADKVMIKTKVKSVDGDNGTYEISITKLKAIDHKHKDGETKIIEKYVETHHHDADDVLDLHGNVAILDVDVSALGENTLVDVEAFVLAIEDQLSESTVLATAAVG